MKLHEVAPQRLPHAKIKQWIDTQYRGITNYTINKDGTVDVTGNANIDPSNTTDRILPVQFRVVTGHFNCCDTKLASLKGMPQRIGGALYCTNTNILSLSGIDKIIKHIGGGVYFDLDVTHILGLLLINGIDYINVDSKGPIDRIMNKYLPTHDVIMAQDELIDAGFIEQAKL